MSAPKIILLAVYALLVVLGVTQAGSTVGIWSWRLLGILAIAHFIETLVYFKLCKAAGGSLPGHLLSVFLFGVLHVNELKAAQGRG
ncbi:MAG: hypothetical protein R3E50_01880 [Halioglobus sp.]